MLKALESFVWRALPGVSSPLENERRLVICLAMTLIAIQTGLMAFLKSEHDGLTSAAIRDVLQGGYQTVQNQVFEEQMNLAAETRLMASEFGLRQAVATQDQPTIDSMLTNHQARSSKIRYAIVPLAVQPAAASPDTLIAPTVNAQNFTLIREPGRDRLVTQKSSDILVPLPIASLQGTLVIDDTFARRISKLTGFELIVSGAEAAGTHRVLATSLAADATETAMQALQNDLPASQAGESTGRGHQAHLAWGASNFSSQTQVSSADLYSFVRVKVLSSPAAGDIWFWIGKPDAKAVPALLDAASVVQGWILVSLVLSVLAVSVVAYKLVRPISASANTDVLTGLFNRRAFMPAAMVAIASCRSQGQSVALISMDLDKFKSINDTLGHAAGDEVLRVTGARLRRFFRAEDLVARLGGDEFCVLLKGVNPVHLPTIIDNVRAVLRVPIAWNGRDVSIGCSIGVTLSHHGETLALEALMDRADAALYDAKRHGSGARFSTPEIVAAAPAA